MNFTVTEKYGHKQISDWLEIRVKEYVKTNYGQEINIEKNPKYTSEVKSVKSPTLDK